MKTIPIKRNECMEFLKAVPDFVGLSDVGVAALVEHGLVREYEQDEYLFQQDEDAGGFHVLIEGAVSVHRFGPDGRQQVLHVFDGGGELVGEVPVFQGSTYPAAAMALKKTRTFYLSRGGLLEVARDHPEVLLSMLATLSLRLRRFVGLIDDLSLKDVSARLAKFILEQASEQERATVSLNTTKAALASRLGTIAETISRTFRKLQEAGVIDVKGRSITILNEKTLRDIADGMKI